MAITSGFFNSKNGDRKYDTVDWSSMFEGMFADGVFKTIGENFAPKAGSGMQVTIGTGKAWFNKAFIKNSSLHQVAINTSDVLLDRIDAIVIEINHTESVRQGTIKYIAGTPASSPSKPALTKSEQVNQYPITYVTVPHGSSSISQSNIEVMVGKSECPFAVGLIEGIDIDYMFSQWESQFNEWFDRMKDQLSTDAAGKLQVEIDETNERITAMHEVVEEIVTIQPSEWDSANLCSIINNKIKPGVDVNIELPYGWNGSSTDYEMIKAIQNSNIILVLRDNGSAHKINLHALNGKPTIAIKLRVIYSGNISGVAAQTLSENSIETYSAPEIQNRNQTVIKI